MKLYHGSQVRDFVPTYGLGNDTHDMLGDKQEPVKE